MPRLLAMSLARKITLLTRSRVVYHLHEKTVWLGIVQMEPLI